MNLAVDDAYTQVIDRHRDLLLEWCRRTGDVFDDHYAHPGLPTIPGYEDEEIAEQ